MQNLVIDLGIKLFSSLSVGRVRSLRYFTAVRDMQQGAKKVKCPACGKGQGTQEWAIMSCCGHQGCYR